MPEPTFSYVDIDLLHPNPWNPNQMSEDMLGKEIESIHRFGFVDPITCREVGLNDYQIIDGEHRWRCAADHSDACVKVKGKYTEHVGLRQLPITNLGMIDDHIAKQLTIVLNETRGEAEPKKLGQVLTNLLAGEPMAELLELLPFTQPQFEELAQLPTVDWGAMVSPKMGGPRRAEQWVERVYRLRTDEAKALDGALAEAKSNGAQSDGEAIQRIAEEYTNAS